MEHIIAIKKLVKTYDQNVVLDIENLGFIKGQSLGIVGNNGAGKTTLFRLILDLIEPTIGEVYSKQNKVHENEDWKTYTGSFLDEGFLIDYLSPDEYFNFLGKLHGLSPGDINDKLSLMEPLFKGEIRGHKKLIRDLSKGNQKKVGIAGALLGNPEILVLDEPFANLDPSTQFLLRSILRDLDANTDMTMLISSHDLVHVTEFCQRIIVLDKGKIVKDIHTNEQTLSELERFFNQEIREEDPYGGVASTGPIDADEQEE